MTVVAVVRLTTEIVPLVIAIPFIGHQLITRRDRTAPTTNRQISRRFQELLIRRNETVEIKVNCIVNDAGITIVIDSETIAAAFNGFVFGILTAYAITGFTAAVPVPVRHPAHEHGTFTGARINNLELPLSALGIFHLPARWAIVKIIPLALRVRPFPVIAVD